MVEYIVLLLGQIVIRCVTGFTRERASFRVRVGVNLRAPTYLNSSERYPGIYPELYITRIYIYTCAHMYIYVYMCAHM